MLYLVRRTTGPRPQWIAIECDGTPYWSFHQACAQRFRDSETCAKYVRQADELAGIEPDGYNLEIAWTKCAPNSPLPHVPLAVYENVRTILAGRGISITDAAAMHEWIDGRQVRDLI